jgi:hypothetical protein
LPVASHVSCEAAPLAPDDEAPTHARTRLLAGDGEHTGPPRSRLMELHAVPLCAADMADVAASQGVVSNVVLVRFEVATTTQSKELAPPGGARGVVGDRGGAGAGGEETPARASLVNYTAYSGPSDLTASN